MSVPVFVVQAHGGKILSFDDATVVRDLAALAGTGGNVYTPYLLSDRLELGGYGKLRRVDQSVDHDGTATVAITPWRDGMDTGQTISRDLALGDPPYVQTPHDVSGSEVQIKIAVTAFSAPVRLGSAKLAVQEKREAR